MRVTGRVVLPLLLWALVAAPTNTPSAAAPWIIIVHGAPLPERVILNDWHENARLMLAIADYVPESTAALDGRPFLRLAMFWGPGWASVARDSAVLRELRPEGATQQGRLYPALGSLPAVVVLGGEVSPTGIGGLTSTRLLGAEGRALLHARGVPVTLP